MKKSFGVNQSGESFDAQVFMCEHHYAANQAGFWILRLLSNKTMIEAYQWDRAGQPLKAYQAGDELLISGIWADNKKTRLQILDSELVAPEAANEPFIQGEQLELDLRMTP